MSEAFRAFVTRSLFPAILVLPAVHLVTAGLAGGGSFLLALLLFVPFLALGQLVVATLGLLTARNLQVQALPMHLAAPIAFWYAAVLIPAFARGLLLPFMILSVLVLAMAVFRLVTALAAQIGSISARLRQSARSSFRTAKPATEERVPEWEQPGASRVYYSAASSAGRAQYARRQAWTGSTPTQRGGDGPVQLGELVLVED